MVNDAASLGQACLVCEHHGAKTDARYFQGAAA